MKNGTARPVAPSRTVVRPLLLTDCKAAYSMARANSPNSPAIGHFERHTTDETMRVGIAADYGGKLAGVLTASIFPAKGANRGYMAVSVLTVSSKFRRLGIGTRLLRRACQRIVAAQVVMAVEEGNLAAQLFLKSCGFKASPKVGFEAAMVLAPSAGPYGEAAPVEPCYYEFLCDRVDDFEHAVARRCVRYDEREGSMWSHAAAIPGEKN